MDTTPVPSRGWPWPWVLVVIGALARLAPLVLPFDFAGPDSITYLEPARGVAAGLGYVDASGAATALRPPGYPLFLASVFALGGDLFHVRCAQALLGGLSALGVFLVLRRVTGRAEVAWLGGALVALDPIAVGQSPFVLREALLSGLLLGLVCAQVLLKGRVRALASGVALGGLALTHQLYVLLGGFLFLAAALAQGRRLRGRILVWVGMALLVATPVFLWARRTERVTGHLSLSSSANAVPARELWLTTACPNLWLNGDDVSGFQAAAFAEERALVDSLGVAETKAIYYARTRANWTGHPVRSAARLGLMNFWYWAEVPGSIRLARHPRLFWVRWLLISFHWVRLCAAAAGVLYLLRAGAWRPYHAPLACLAFLALAPALLYPVPRYLAPGVPLLDLFAALGVARAWAARSARGGSARVGAEGAGAS